MRHTLLSLIVAFGLIHTAAAQHLPGTAPLTEKGDFARKMLDGLNRWLDKQTAATASERGKNFKPDFSSAEAHEKSLEPKRERLKTLLGVIDTRVSPAVFQGVGVPGKPSMVAETAFIKAYAVRWPVLPGVTGEGLLLEPRGTAVANVVALPDAEQTPEQIAAMVAGPTPACGHFALRLAENGCRVLIPTLIDRNDTWSGSPSIGRMTNQSHREFVQRMAWEMGRTIAGYELQRIFAGFDAMEAKAPKLPRGMYGYGEGGRLAMYAAAIDPRIKATVVSGEFGPRENLHEEPIDRSVWSILREFGPAELQQMIAPRMLVIETAEFNPAPLPVARPGRGGAAPGTLRAPTAAEIEAEQKRFASLMTGAKESSRIVVTNASDRRPVDDPPATVRLRNLLGPNSGVSESEKPAKVDVDVSARQKRQFDELVDYTQKRMPEAVQKRKQHVWDRLDVKSPEAFVKSQEPVRQAFVKDIIGNMPEPNKDMKPRTRLILDTPKWKGYEVVLDIFDDVISYGILLVPNDIKPGEKRPCVVCQHGLEGRPMDVVDPTKKTPYYNSFGAQLADRGYVVFAPQAPYIFKNDFRQVVRKMHPLGYNLYAIIVRQHQQVLNFLGTLDFVDSRRIAYYGLSYGGKVAMRIPACLIGYCAVICSGDFNEWIWKNINLEWSGSYMFTGEYDMYEFNLGNTFNYAEMSALIAPRPFMVERGHDDGVGLDEYVAFEYAKTRRLYSRLKMPERTEIEFFAGGHECHCVGTFAFLSKHLNWPAK